MKVIKILRNSGCTIEVLVCKDGTTIAHWRGKIKSIQIFNSYNDFATLYLKNKDQIVKTKAFTFEDEYKPLTAFK